MASIFQTFPMLRQVAPRLARRYFTCSAHQVPQSSFSQSFAAPLYRSKRNTPFLQAFRTQATRKQTTFASNNSTGAIERIIAEGGKSHGTLKKSFFPETSEKSVAYWLLGSAASVFGIVVWGGLTRLTESGLSITEWRPVTGSIPPTTAEDWDSEFTKYRSSPEFQILNPNMTVEEFKQIYFFEWTHRLWGRLIGVTFLVPTVYFIARKKVSANMAARLIGITGMIGFQGFIGWWMVKSGLKDDLFAPGSHPRVSQYRLTAHLGAAFLVYASMLVSGLRILQSHRLQSSPSAAQSTLSTLNHPALRSFRVAVSALSVLVFVTAMSGALVAGLDAGLIYNEFPWMGKGLTPPKSELWDPWYSQTSDKSDLWWRNMTANPSLVQLDHRILATTTFTAVMSLFAWTRFSPALRNTLPRSAMKGTTGLVHLVLLQVTLGISTLIYLVPTWLAASHQAGSLALLTGALILGTRVHVPGRTIKLLQKSIKQGKSAIPRK